MRQLVSEDNPLYLVIQLAVDHGDFTSAVDHKEALTRPGICLLYTSHLSKTRDEITFFLKQEAKFSGIEMIHHKPPYVQLDVICI